MVSGCSVYDECSLLFLVANLNLAAPNFMNIMTYTTLHEGNVDQT